MMMSHLFKSRILARVVFFIALLTAACFITMPFRLQFVRVETEAAEIPPPAQESPPVLIAEVSAYTSRPEETDDTPEITASGERVRDGGIACPSRYEFGTLIEIAGKIYTCNDRMNARYRDTNHFDIWLASYDDAMRFGRQHLPFSVVE